MYRKTTKRSFLQPRSGIDSQETVQTRLMGPEPPPRQVICLGNPLLHSSNNLKNRCSRKNKNSLKKFSLIRFEFFKCNKLLMCFMIRGSGSP